MNVWCINLETGDKYHAKKWRNFYNLEKKEPHNQPYYGHFTQNSIVGMLVDLDRGCITYYKNGIMIGVAFLDDELKEGKLYPFLQI